MTDTPKTPNPHAAALGAMGRGKKKTLTEAQKAVLTRRILAAAERSRAANRKAKAAQTARIERRRKGKTDEHK